LLGVKVELIDLSCAELLQQYVYSDPSTAAHVEYARDIKPSTEFQ